MPTTDCTQDGHGPDAARTKQGSGSNRHLLDHQVLTPEWGIAPRTGFSTGGRVGRIGIAIPLGLDIGIFVVALLLQFSVRRYVAWVYWFAVVAVSLFGTWRGYCVLYGIPLWASSSFYAVALR